MTKLQSTSYAFKPHPTVTVPGMCVIKYRYIPHPVSVMCTATPQVWFPQACYFKLLSTKAFMYVWRRAESENVLLNMACPWYYLNWWRTFSVHLFLKYGSMVMWFPVVESTQIRDCFSSICGPCSCNYLTDEVVGCQHTSHVRFHVHVFQSCKCVCVRDRSESNV